MLSIGMAGVLLGRHVSSGARHCGTALVLRRLSPSSCFDVSLQLSLASVVGIALRARSLGPRGAPETARPGGRAGPWLWQFGAATVAATRSRHPGRARFGEVAPLAPLGNLALVPLVELGVVPLGLFGGLLAALSPRSGRCLSLAGRAAGFTLAIAGGFRAHAPVWVCRMPNRSRRPRARGGGAPGAARERAAGAPLAGGGALSPAVARGQPAGARLARRRHADARDDVPGRRAGRRRRGRGAGRPAM